MARETITPRMTAREIDGLMPTAKERLVSCDVIPNLYLVISPQGAKRWAWIAKGMGKMKIGKLETTSLSDARNVAIEYNKLRGEGIDPKTHYSEMASRAAAAERAEAANTASAVVASWIADKRREGKAVKTVHEYDRQLTRNLIPAMGDRPIANVTRADIKKVIDVMIDRGARAQSNRVLMVIQQFLKWAVANEYVEKNVAETIGTVAEKRKNADRALSISELATLYRAAESLPDDQRDGLRLLILTGTRRNEALGAASADYDGSWWVVPPSDYTDARGHTFPVSHSKTEHEHPMPLPPLAKAIFDRRANRKYLFHDAPHKFMYPDLARDADAAVEKLTGSRFASWNLHDIRAGVRTALSSDEMDEMLESEGRGEVFSEQIAEIVLNHSLGKLNRTYNKSKYGRQTGRALAALERLLREELARQGAPIVDEVEALAEAA